MYQAAPPVTFATKGLYGGTGPNEDPIGDTFDTGLAAQFGYSVPDIVSVTGSVQGGQSVITIKLSAPVSLGGGPPNANGFPPDQLWAFVFLKTTGTTTANLPPGVDLSLYFPFSDLSTEVFDTWIGLFEGEGAWVSFKQLTGGTLQVSAIGNTVTLSVPSSALDLSGALAVVLVGNPLEFTDVAPNNGVLKLVP
jgi:hypothetical protein